MIHRTLLRSQQSTKFLTASPCVSDFWHSCVNTPSFVGPNVSLAKVNKVSTELAVADEKATSGQILSAIPTRHDALLLANLANRQKQVGGLLSSSDASGSSSSAAGSSSASLPLPEFIYRRKTKDIQQEADKIYHAYLEYYNHIKFRQGWEKPVFPKDDLLATEMLHEAADISARIRARLDEENPSTKLRQADGSAQLFFNNPDCANLFNAAKAESEQNDKLMATGGATDGISQYNRREFVKTIVLNTFKDAMGFVEGLSKSKLEKYFADISDFGFNPSAHMQHLLLEMLASAEVARLSFDVSDAVKYASESYDIVCKDEDCSAPSPSTGGDGEAGGEARQLQQLPPTVSKRALDRARQSRDNAHFCVEDGAEDKLWRDAIGKLYKAHDALLLAVAERKKNALRGVSIHHQSQDKQ